VALERGELGRENSEEWHGKAVTQVAAWLASRVSSSKQQQWCHAISGKKKGGKEKKIKRKTRERPVGPRSWAATGKLGWTTQGEKERKNGMCTRETNGHN
jgi:hypothetical protein